MLYWFRLSSFFSSSCNMSENIKSLNICGLVVDDTVNGKDNMEEKTSEVADIRRYHFNWKFSTTQDVICCCDCVRPERFFVNS